MKKLISIVCLSIVMVLAISSVYANELMAGTGIIDVKFQAGVKLAFYNDTTSTAPAAVVEVLKNKYVFKNEQSVIKWFQPEGMMFDYDIFEIRVTEIKRGWYKVYVNNTTGRQMWLKASNKLLYSPWQKFLKETSAVNCTHTFNQFIRKQPLANGVKIRQADAKLDCYEVMAVKGDWIKIRTNTKLDCDESKLKINSGWIRWRYNNKLVIEFFVTC